MGTANPKGPSPMILAQTDSEKFKHYLKDSGGALTVTLRTMVVN